MSATLNVIRGELTTNCICHYCEVCEVGFTAPCGDNECGYCGTEADWDYNACTGTCGDDQKEDFFYVFGEWSKATDSQWWYVGGRNIGWLHQAGHTDATSDPEKVLEYLGLERADFTLHYEFDEAAKTFTVSRFSHDEYGASLEVYVCERCESCGDGIRQHGNVWEALDGTSSCEWYGKGGPHRPEGR
jgi:hypothetical protein